eukprot:678356-Pelagomonas_calceolata.AAC.1
MPNMDLRSRAVMLVRTLAPPAMPLPKRAPSLPLRTTTPMRSPPYPLLLLLLLASSSWSAQALRVRRATHAGLLASVWCVGGGLAAAEGPLRTEDFRL